MEKFVLSFCFYYFGAATLRWRRGEGYFPFTEKYKRKRRGEQKQSLQGKRMGKPKEAARGFFSIKY